MTRAEEVPARIARLPMNKQGYRVPWFVHQTGEQEWDFRVVRSQGLALAHGRRLCWICGQAMSAYKSFLVGPMCVVNRISAEPPMHRECALYSTEACPFMLRPSMRRRTTGMDEHFDAAGVMIERNPGVVALWTTKKYTLEVVSGSDKNHPGMLFNIGEPHSISWHAEGRRATRAEVLASIESGYPLLLEAAARPHDRAELDVMYETAMTLVPAEAATQ